MDLNLLKQVFPEEQFIIEFENNDDNSPTIKGLVEIHTKAESAETFCAQIKANRTDILEIKLLSKCGISGSQTLNKIENFARLSGFTKLKLSDISKIEICGKYFDLANIKILTKGQSWYNSLGYKSVNYAEELENNRTLIQKSFNEIFTQEKMWSFDRDRKIYFSNSLKKILNIGEDNVVENLTLQSIFQMVVNLAKNCGNKDARILLEDLLNFIAPRYTSSKIKYNPDLIKDLGEPSESASSEQEHIRAGDERSKRSVTKRGGRKRTNKRKKYLKRKTHRK